MTGSQCTKYPRDQAEERFFLLHRYRVFNSRQGVWMGWERKRGKLLDLNKFLLNEFDSVPASKLGPLDALQGRSLRHYTRLRHPATSRHRCSHDRHHGASAEPGDRSILASRVVTRGIWNFAASRRRQRQPLPPARASPLSTLVRPASTSTLAPFQMSIKISLVKVSSPAKASTKSSILHQLLDRRFPQQFALLSHDLIEGSYVACRSGDRYRDHRRLPVSLLSSHSPQASLGARRLADCAVALRSKVPDESGNRLVANPISTISRFKILDNLRRSLS